MSKAVTSSGTVSQLRAEDRKCVGALIVKSKAIATGAGSLAPLPKPSLNGRYLAHSGRLESAQISYWRTGAGQAVGVGPDSPPSTCALPLATLNPAATQRMSQQPLIGPPTPSTSDNNSAPLQTRISAPSGPASAPSARPRQAANSQIRPPCAASRTRRRIVGGTSSTNGSANR